MDYSFSDRIKDLSGNAIREIFKLLSSPEIISFAGGMPATACLPAAEVKRYSAECIEQDPVGVLQYGNTEGYLPFRKTLADYIRRTGIEGMELDNILAISGGQQGIDLMCKCFLNKGDRVLVQTPTYLAVLHILKTYEAEVHGIASDEEGLDLEDLENKIKKYSPKFVYLVPNFLNPTGKTLGTEKRKRALEICSEYGVVIVEDDPYRELRYSGEALPAIKSFDKEGLVVYLTSFSKTVSPGMRVGGAFGDAKLIRKLTIGKQAVDVHTNSLAQAIVNKMIINGDLDRNIARAVPIYREKRDAMISALEKYMPDSFEFTRPDGGLFIWGEFKDGKDVVENFKKAVSNNVAYVSGTDFFADGVSGRNCMRLNFSNATLEQIERGVKALAKTFA